MKIQPSTLIFFVCTAFFFTGIAIILRGAIENVKEGLVMAGCLMFVLSVMLSVKSKAISRSTTRIRIPK
jgi:hypothetical protein